MMTIRGILVAQTLIAFYVWAFKDQNGAMCLAAAVAMFAGLFYWTLWMDQRIGGVDGQR